MKTFLARLDLTELITGVLGIALGAFIIGYSQLNLKRGMVNAGPDIWPTLLGVILLAISFWVLLDVYRFRGTAIYEKTETKEDSVSNWNGYTAMAIMVVYVMLFPTLGYFLSTVSLCVSFCWTITRGQKTTTVQYVKYMVLVIIVVVSVNILFGKILGVRLPRGLFSPLDLFF